MKRLALATIVLSIVPIGARADAGCTALLDPVRDLHFAGVEQAGDVARGGEAVDLRRVAFAVEGGLVAVAIDLRDVDAASTPLIRTATYVVGWTSSGVRSEVRAQRSGRDWTFDQVGPDGVREITGVVDPDAERITMWAPLGAASGSLEDIRAASEGRAPRVPPTTDHAPNRAGWKMSIPLDGSCDAATNAEACQVVGGAPQDPAPRASLDLRGVTLTARADTVLARIAVADLAEPAAGTAERWEVAWLNPRFFEGDEHQLAFAERAGERVEFGFARGATVVSATGVLDIAGDAIEIVVPREHLGLSDGTRLSKLTAISWDGNGGAWTSMDHETGAPWVVAPVCGAAPVQACPVVIDRAGDARSLQLTGDMPENHAGLDLRGVGVTPTAEHVTLAARVSNLTAPPPPAADVSGWTISWLDGDRRVYAQAERTDADAGLVFRYGARAADGEAPSGPVFAGTATTGRLDAARGVIEIDVPRSAMPADGVVLEGFGATAWAQVGRHTAALYLVWDETVSRPYQAGAACSV